ncbi:MAG: hypothetical protein HYV99_02170 [Betaproteobacteria bacterium]|nr:hypothetical protein [Betaproteobacteria bacterium]MBI2508821.1 hypothetical protein [Betaproteobacteria bacterium]
MNRNQKIALAIAAANLLLILLFPPYDQYSIANIKVPVFAGFNFAFAAPPYGEINTAVLTLEAAVVLINAGIAWLLLRDGAPAAARRKFGFQNATLAFTGANLVLMLLFPPFESVFALTNATLPTFEGFYFIFSRKPSHVIVTTLLYIEVIFILINGALFWLIFKPKTSQELAAEQARDLAEAMQKKK